MTQQERNKKKQERVDREALKLHIEKLREADPDTEYDLFLARASDYTQADQLQDELDDVFLATHNEVNSYDWEGL